MATLISMEYSPAEAKQETVEAMEMQEPKYPWGLCISLDNEALKKLSMNALPDVGATFTIMARCEVASVNQSQYQNDKEPDRNVSLQITDMAIEPAAQRDDTAIASMMYNGQ